MKQEILNFQFLEYNKDFFVSPKNKMAFDYVQKWPKWNAKVTYVYGPEKCGKTLFSQMWADKSDAIFLDEKVLGEFASNKVQIEDIKNNVYGFQFHPESFLTQNGKTIIKKILSA